MNWSYAPYMSFAPESQEELDARRSDMLLAVKEFHGARDEMQPHGRVHNGMTSAGVALWYIKYINNEIETDFNKIKRR